MIKIRHTGLVTNDIKKSLVFWTKYLKFKIKKKLEEDGDLIDKLMLYQNAKVKTYKLIDNNKMLLELLYFKNAPKIKKIKLNLIQMDLHTYL